MFHVYVQGAKGHSVDMGRAQFLMDKVLLRQAIAAMTHERDTCPRWDAIYDNQWIWGYYCERYWEKYGEPFITDVDPNWA